MPLPNPKKNTRTPRRRAREFAVQGLYQWLLTGSNPHTVAQDIATLEGYDKSDRPMFDRLWKGAVAERDAIDTMLTPYLDRAPSALSPIEHAILLLASYELKSMIETPYRVVINEAVELAKSFGGVDGHKYVNGVLDKMAAELRGPEVEHLRSERAARNAQQPEG